VLERRLADHEYISGEYSITDTARVGWIVPHAKQGQKLALSRLKTWPESVACGG